MSRVTPSRRSRTFQTSDEITAPRRLSNSNIIKALDTLQKVDTARKNKRAKFSVEPLEDENDDDPDSPSPIMDRFIEVRGVQCVYTATNFYLSEYDKIYRELRPYTSTHWNVGSGRKRQITNRDMLFMALTALKNCGTWDFVAAMFCQTGSTFSIRVVDFLTMLRPCISDNFIRHTRDKNSMLYMVRTGRVFKHFPEARYAVDVTFQQAEAPSGAYAEKKKFFSKKHGLYGHKVEVSVIPSGFAIGITNYANGNVSDKTIFDENEAFHQSQLIKQPDERDLLDDGPLKEDYPNHWALLADKGYQGIGGFDRGITPMKKPPGSHLSFEDSSNNDNISSDRVIVEKIFGRLKTLWNVVGGCYRWDRDKYDIFFECCVAFTNVHIGFHPLRLDDSNEYRRYMRRLKQIAEKTARTRRETRERYKRKRVERLNDQLDDNNIMESDPEEGYGSDTLMDSFHDE